MHDSSKVLLGATRSNIKEATPEVGYFQAGLAVRIDSSNELSVTKADGALIGISLGKTLDGVSGKSVVCREGILVPVLLKSGETMAVGEQLGIDDATGEAASVDTGVTGTNGIVKATGITGVKEDGTEANVVLVDMIGGL